MGQKPSVRLMEYPLVYMGLYGLYMEYQALTKWDAHPSMILQ